MTITKMMMLQKPTMKKNKRSSSRKLELILSLERNFTYETSFKF